MPKINKNAQEETNDSAIANAVENALGSLTVVTNPVMIVGVNRRAAMVGYEHIDIYAGLALPMIGASLEEPEALSLAVQDAAELGFREVSKETFSRYQLIKGEAEESQ